jgi:outer membrane protein OmpA-like peptidoglycan-associated protein
MKNITTLFAILLLSFTAQAQQVQVTPFEHNSNKDDFSTAVSGNGRLLFFTSDRNGAQAVYVSERSSGGWSDPSTISGDVDEAQQSGVPSLTSDGQFMVFSAFKHDVSAIGRTDIYSARKMGGSWKQITNLGTDVNSTSFDAQPTISADGALLFFVSDRPGGKGATDIYYCKRTANGWSAAQPVQGINTDKREMAPVLAPDGKTLTFSSDRQGGAGGLDLYVATVVDGKATNLARMDRSINTADDELFYASFPNANQAMFTRGSDGAYDLMLAVPNPYPGDPVVMVDGIVSDAMTKKPLGADITITDLTTGQRVASLRSDDETGAYHVILTQGRNYSVTAQQKGYVFHTEEYRIPPSTTSRTYEKNIELQPIKGGGARLLVFFDFDKDELKSESIPELERVIELLRDNPSINAAFEGHTDDQGAEDYNVSLSQRRANAVRTYVEAAGIPGARISAKGYGETRPLVQGTTDEARAMNRRVEMKIVE